MKKDRKGFTLAELLIVIAIIAVLVAVVIPLINNQLEKARHAVDMHTARSIESVLMAAVTEGRIVVPEDATDKGVGGAWVLFCKEGSQPQNYTTGKMKKGTFFCGADKGVIVDDATSDSWQKFNTQVENILAESGITIDTTTIHCAKSNKNKNIGWDWIVIQVGYRNGKYESRIFSGFAGRSSGTNTQDNKNQTNIEKEGNRQLR